MDKKDLPSNVASCNDKPKFWDDDMKMNAWFAPFRNRDLNPLNYDNKMNYWKRNVEYFCNKTYTCSLSITGMQEFFERNGKMPYCLSLVFDSLIKDGTILAASEYENYLANGTWSGWAVNTFISSPSKWLSKKIITAITSPEQEIDELAEFIHLPSLKKFADILYKCVVSEVKDDIVTYEQVNKIYSKHIGVSIDMNTVEHLVQWLKSEKKVDVKYEDKHCHVDLLKFALKSKPLSPINDTDISVFVLKHQEKQLNERVFELEAEEKRLTDEVKSYLKTGQKNTMV